MATLETVNADLRLAPVTRPRGILQRLIQWYFRYRFGKPLLPLQVIHARIPGYTRPYLALMRFAEWGLSLPGPLRHALSVRVSLVNGCDFCTDLHRAAALVDGHGSQLLADLTDPQATARLDAPTRAALTYADEVARTGQVSEETFQALHAHYGERQIVEIVWLVAFTVFHNLQAKPLGLHSQGYCAVVSSRR